MDVQDSADFPAIAQRCARWYEEPAIRAKGWASNLFWRSHGREPESLRVDALELEVLFAALLGRAAAGEAELEAREPGRAAFIRRSIAHGELPLLRFRAASSASV
ncbi:hypothetical protein [Acidithiobacillus sp.]|uniref:hypothetical protein n=1 Tax=Acidithiobacillus sp. TaxID=1872118 RepID=UPI0025C5778B|nr:hypothetical protein [Acidithiobacillus sp.]